MLGRARLSALLCLPPSTRLPSCLEIARVCYCWRAPVDGNLGDGDGCQRALGTSRKRASLVTHGVDRRASEGRCRFRVTSRLSRRRRHPSRAPPVPGFFLARRRKRTQDGAPASATAAAATRDWSVAMLAGLFCLQVHGPEQASVRPSFGSVGFLDVSRYKQNLHGPRPSIAFSDPDRGQSCVLRAHFVVVDVLGLGEAGEVP